MLWTSFDAHIPIVAGFKWWTGFSVGSLTGLGLCSATHNKLQGCIYSDTILSEPTLMSFSCGSLSIVSDHGPAFTPHHDQAPDCSYFGPLLKETDPFRPPQELQFWRWFDLVATTALKRVMFTCCH
ncbi:hypothetical protein ATANTOWER_029719 [Ataeniobius toweri]|uniref:Uncharacterized protein n=1 Tax=Ataeniobius toweri TaxID=208326 RepID=A0ABU7C680_9TELE|nr:hypothetical protein [Ataeniobius toweri]